MTTLAALAPTAEDRVRALGLRSAIERYEAAQDALGALAIEAGLSPSTLQLKCTAAEVGKRAALRA